MARTNTTIIYSTNGNDSLGWYDRRKAHVFSGNVTINTGAPFATLPVTVPPRSRVIWARLSNQTTVPVTGGIGTTTTAPGGYAIVGWPTTATTPVTAPPSTASVTFANASGTNGGIIALAISTASAVTANGAPICERVAGVYGTNAYVFQNTNTTPAFLALVPCFTNSTGSYAYQANGTASTAAGTQGAFGTSTTLSTATTYTAQFELYVEEFQIVT